MGTMVATAIADTKGPKNNKRMETTDNTAVPLEIVSGVSSSFSAETRNSIPSLLKFHFEISFFHIYETF